MFLCRKQEVRLCGSKREFGGEGEYGAARWAAAEPAVGGFWHGPGREGAARGPRVAARTAAGRGRVNTSPKERAVRGATGAGREEEVQAERGRGAGRMRPPQVRQRAMSSAKTRARSFAQPMRRGLGEDVGEEAAGSLGRAKSSASCGCGGAAGLGMTCSRRRWWLANTP